METRVRMGVKSTAKGTVNVDVTAEADNASRCAELLTDGIAQFKGVVEAEGFILNEAPNKE